MTFYDRIGYWGLLKNYFWSYIALQMSIKASHILTVGPNLLGPPFQAYCRKSPSVRCSSRWEIMFSSGTKCYHLGWNVIIWNAMLSSGDNVFIWDKMLSSGMKCYHLGWNVIIWNAMLSSGDNVFIWDKMLSSGMKCYHLGCNVIIWS